LRLFENRVLGGVFGPKGGGGSWRLYNPHSSPYIIRVIKLRLLGWAVHAARIVRREIHEKFWSENLEGSERLDCLDVDGRLGLILGRCEMCVAFRTEVKVKIKVKLFLCFLTKHHAMKAYWGIGGVAPLIL
jgi:hypothetical protein